MNTHHIVKSQAPHFQQLWDGLKTFEVRFNDRAYASGDTIEQREWCRDAGYTGRRTLHRIGYISTYAQVPGWVVFSLVPTALDLCGGWRLGIETNPSPTKARQQP